MLPGSVRQLSGSMFKTLKTNMKMSSIAMSSYENLAITTPKPYVFQVELNRPDRINAMNDLMWKEMGKCFDKLNENPECRVIVVTGAGRLFTAGVDLKDFMKLAPQLEAAGDLARKAKILDQIFKIYQHSFTAMELCNKPVIAAVHNGCIGAGVNLITAVDMRYCTKDAYFQLKEVDIGMAADVGALQRLPKIIGNQSLVREFCFTGRKMGSAEALSSGLVSEVFEDKESMLKSVLTVAEQIAAKSPVAVQGTKKSLVYARDHSVQEGLNQIAVWNQFMLQSDDFATAVMAQATKNKDVTFSNL